MMIALVALGGAAGSVLRYLLSALVQRSSGAEFPLGTLVVNVTGALLLGFLLRYWFDGANASAGTRALLTTGFCGGYTTFSTFSYEAVALAHRGDLRRAVLYVTLSVLLSLAGVAVGMGTARELISAQRPGSATGL